MWLRIAITQGAKESAGFRRIAWATKFSFKRARKKRNPVQSHNLTVNWERFEKSDKEHFEQVPVTYSRTNNFRLPDDLRKFGASLKHGTVIEIKKLRRSVGPR